MLHDEKVFSEPFKFRPERFLDERGVLRELDKAEDPALGFGFGRRYVVASFEHKLTPTY